MERLAGLLGGERAGVTDSVGRFMKLTKPQTQRPQLQ